MRPAGVSAFQPLGRFHREQDGKGKTGNPDEIPHGWFPFVAFPDGKVVPTFPGNAPVIPFCRVSGRKSGSHFSWKRSGPQ
jgi:hypothetical protein